MATRCCLQRLLFSLFSLVALIMSAAGIYGVMAYFVAMRTREIGIRLALGAQRHDVLKLVLRTGMILAVTGLTLGLASAFALSRLMSTLLFEVAPTDPVTFVAVAAFLILVALLACYIPARRAMKVDPLVALRNE